MVASNPLGEAHVGLLHSTLHQIKTALGANSLSLPNPVVLLRNLVTYYSNTGSSGVAGEAKLILASMEGLCSTSRRHDVEDQVHTGSLSFTSSKIWSGDPTPRHSSRFTGTFQRAQIVSPTLDRIYKSDELPNPEVSAYHQSLFSRQPLIRNHLIESTRITGKSLINSASVDDDELLKRPSVQSRRPTNRQIPVLPVAVYFCCFWSASHVLEKNPNLADSCQHRWMGYYWSTCLYKYLDNAYLHFWQYIQWTERSTSKTVYIDGRLLVCCYRLDQ